MVKSRGSPTTKHRIAESRLGRALFIFISVAAILLSVRGARASDCNANGIDDLLDISSGTSRDCNANAVPDECDLSEESIAFEARDPLPAGFSASALAQDFDGDRNPDLMVSEFFPPGGKVGQPEVHALAYFRNLGQGRFDAPMRYEVPERPYALFAEDMDRDGDADVLVIFAQSDQAAGWRGGGRESLPMGTPRSPCRGRGAAREDAPPPVERSSRSRPAP